MDWTVFFVVVIAFLLFAACLIGYAWIEDKIRDRFGRAWAMLFSFAVIGVVFGALGGFMSGSQP